MRKIEVHPYNPNWALQFQSEAEAIKQAIPLNLIIHHIGSTSVPGMAAKPVIDILMEIETISTLDEYEQVFNSIGYSAKGEFGISGRRFYTKGGDFRTRHIHAFSSGSEHITRHLAFRDYLIAHPEFASEYAELKKKVASSCNHNNNAYCDGKHEFVQYHEALALDWISTVQGNATKSLKRRQ